MSIENHEKIDEEATASGEVTDEPVEDESENDESVPSIPYDVTSYGSDPDVEGLVRRLTREEILIPPFQRNYIWKQPEASKFIESLLLGLPVPGIFLATDPATNKFLVIDGQQRLKSLQFFYDGYFNPIPDEKRRRVFNLVKVQEQFEGKTYKNLEERDRIRLDNSIIHATIVKQTSPPGDDTSLHHIFGRLNSGGRRLVPQEIRVALNPGPLMDLISQLNQNEFWRLLFGRPNSRLKDQELILRFMALYIDNERYARPMEEFLNKFTSRNRLLSKISGDSLETVFNQCCETFWKALGKEAFRPARSLNAAVYDSCMFGLARRLRATAAMNIESVKHIYDELLSDSEYLEAISRSTSDEAFVARRLIRSEDKFSKA